MTQSDTHDHHITSSEPPYSALQRRIPYILAAVLATMRALFLSQPRLFLSLFLLRPVLVHLLEEELRVLGHCRRVDVAAAELGMHWCIGHVHDAFMRPRVEFLPVRALVRHAPVWEGLWCMVTLVRRFLPMGLRIACGSAYLVVFRYPLIGE
jgi:hypothetical protein